jgi:sulfur carrier protein ThiS adenylyltransferase
MENGFSFSEVTSFYHSPGQTEKLQRTAIGIAGAGGIGSNCALMLVRSGFDRLVIADFDRVTASNLNRQAFHACHIGKLKVDCLSALCTAVNPDAAITRHAIRIDATNIETLFSTCEVIIEAFDDAASKALLFSKYMNSEKLLVGVSGIAGIGHSERIAVREIRKNCFIVGDESSAVSELQMPHAPRVMVAAAKMADLVLSRVLAGTSPSG